ncbi:hypothetical protein [Vibrio cholerae]|uniref:hypothetical protein n=1 Tax=Vibrio cholerae TaxID=666 RepID=UPI003D2FDAE6
MKKVVKVFLGLAGVFILAIVAVFFFTADMVKSADGFFVAVRNKDMGKAGLCCVIHFRSRVALLRLIVSQYGKF